MTDIYSSGKAKKISAFLRRHWLLVWLIGVSAGLLGLLAAAEYGGSYTSMKRVVASTDEVGQRFSSNILIKNGSTVYVPQYRTALGDSEKENGTYPVDVYIWNYSIDDLGSPYLNDIDYTVSFVLTDIKGDPLNESDLSERNWIRIFDQGNANQGHEEEGQEPGEEDPGQGEETPAQEPTSLILGYNKDTNSYTMNSTGSGFAGNTYTLKYNAAKTDENIFFMEFGGHWDLDHDSDICVKMTATPTPAGDYSDLKPISAVIGLLEIQSTGSHGWQAYLNEQRSDASVLPSAYDGYNLVLNGSGKADITIEWDTTKIDINKYGYSFDSYLKNASGKYSAVADGTEGAEKLTVFGYINGEVEYTPPEEGSSIAKLVVHANTGSKDQNNRSRYNFQVYKKDGYEPEGWSFFTSDSKASLNALKVSIKDK